MKRYRINILKALIILGLSFYSTFSLGQTNLVGMEYFIDTDPGIGNGTNVPLTAGPIINESFTIPTAALSTGVHFLYMRVLDENGVWAMTESRSFFVQATPVPPPAATEVTALEYFIDTDPGPGNGIPLTITAGAVVNLSTSIDVSTLSSGLHFLHVRALDDLGNWGAYEPRPFQVQVTTSPVNPQIVTIEYFFDTDPGVGSGSQIDVSPVPLLSIDTVLNTSSLALGNYDVGIRVQDDQGDWSVTEVANITVCDGPNPAFSIDLNCVGLSTNFTDLSTDLAAGDIYRWDFDGDGNFDDLTVGNTSFTYNTPGIYNVHLQIQPLSGCISNFYQSIEVFDIPVADFTTVNGCVGDPITFTDLSVPGGSNPVYEWDFDGDAIIDDNTIGSTQYIYNAPGNYNASLRIVTGLGCISTQNIMVLIEDVPQAPGILGGNGLSGESVVLTASGSVNGNYRWYTVDGTLIAGEVNETYVTEPLFTTSQFQVSIVSDNGLCEGPKSFIGASIENPRIEVFNVVTVNQNGKHDFLKILNIEQFPGNKVTIYNRWGDRVIEISDYDNLNKIFTGLDDQGNELPDGNYYYVIDKNDGEKNENGYLLLRR